MARILRSFESALVVVALGLAAACSSEEKTPAPPSERPTEPLGVGQIAAILSQLDRMQIQQGTMAVAKTKDKAVRELAEKIIADHRDIEGRLSGMLGRLRVSTAESEAGAEERRYGAAMGEHLKRASGTDFDVTYVEVQIFANRRVIRLIDDALAPQSEDADVRKELEDIRAILTAHELQAMRLRKRYPPPDTDTGR